MRNKFLILTTVALIAFAGWKFRQQQQLAAVQSLAPKLELISLSGERISLRGQSSGPRLLFFWSTSCAICMQEIPNWIALHEQFHALGLKIIGVAMPYDPPSHLAKVKQDFALPYVIGLDVTGEVKTAFQVVGTPTTLFIAKDNRVLYRHQGKTDFKLLQDTIKKTLNPPLSNAAAEMASHASDT